MIWQTAMYFPVEKFFLWFGLVAFASASVVCYTLFSSQRGVRPAPGLPEYQPTETRTYPHARTTEVYSEF
jgi:hypothetical protein